MSTALATLASLTLASSMGSAIVVQDSAALRAAPQDSAYQQTVLWQGEMLEVRGERLDYLQVWDHRRERGGYIRASDVRRIALTPEKAPEILSVLKFFQNTPSAEALSIGLAAAYVQAAPADALAGEQGAQAMDALGTAAEGMARRAMSDISATSNRKDGGNTGMAAPTASARNRAITLTGHMDAAADYGVRFLTYEIEGSMQVCYEGTAFRQLLVMPKATPEQRARAALALTQPACIAPDLTPAERTKVLQRHTQTLDMADAATLPDYQRNRLHVRRAAIWSALAFQKMRQTDAMTPAHTPTGKAIDTDAVAMATRALTEFSGVVPEALPDADWSDYNDAAMRVNAVRWALLPNAANHAAPTPSTNHANAAKPYLQLEQGQPGETCVVLMQAAQTAKSPSKSTASAPAAPAVLARRCTYGVVWQASATLNKEATAMAVAVQPMEGWRELWVLRKTDQGWVISVLPPAATAPSLGYAEWAGWVPGGQRMLVAREARGQGRYYRRTFEVVQLDSLLTEHQSSSASGLPVFQRWQDASWKRLSLSLR